MLTFPRRQALQLRAVMRRAFGNFRGPGPAVCFTVAAGTLNVKATVGDTAVQYTEPCDGTPDTLWLPFQFLADCEGKNDDPVHIEATGKKRVTAQWRDGSVPQIIRYDVSKPAKADNFPAVPGTFVENQPGILQALVDAGECTDPNAVRYAVNCIQLCGAGSINATDGRQMLVQNGFQFPWTEDVLVPSSKVFASAELPRDLPIQIGKTGNWVAIGVGHWLIHLAINVDGRFPDVSRHIPLAAEAKARCLFSAADADFLAETLPRLPCNDADNRPVTLDLNGHVAVRAKGADSPQPTEIVLTGSSSSGEPIRINTNRDYLARAMRLGLREVSITSNKTALACFDERRHFVWMPLDADSAIAPAKDAIRIESPGADSEKPVTKPRIERKVSPVSETVTNQNGNAAAKVNGQSNGHAKANGHNRINRQARKATSPKAGQQDIAALIEQAVKLRTALHDRMHEAGELVKALKQHRRQSRAVQQTLDQIRTLKTLGV